MKKFFLFCAAFCTMGMNAQVLPRIADFSTSDTQILSTSKRVAATPASTPIQSVDAEVQDDVTFTISVENITTSKATVKVVPSSNQLYYFFDNVIVSRLPEEFDTDVKIADFMLEQYLLMYAEDSAAIAQSYGIISFENAYCSVGPDFYDYSSLSPATTYRTIAFQYDPATRKAVASTVTAKEWQTLAVSGSENTFTFQLNTQENIIEVIPSNDDPYMYSWGWGVQEWSEFNDPQEAHSQFVAWVEDYDEQFSMAGYIPAGGLIAAYTHIGKDTIVVDNNNFYERVPDIYTFTIAGYKDGEQTTSVTTYRVELDKDGKLQPVAETPDAVENINSLEVQTAIQNRTLSLTVEGQQTVEIYNLDGKSLIRTQATQSFRCELPQGLYMVRVGNYTNKVMIH